MAGQARMGANNSFPLSGNHSRRLLLSSLGGQTGPWNVGEIYRTVVTTDEIKTKATSKRSKGRHGQTKKYPRGMPRQPEPGMSPS